MTILFGSLSALSGLVVIVGWHTHTEILVHLRPGFVAMVYNTALCFVFCGTGIVAIALGRRRVAIPGAVLASSIGLLTLGEYQFAVDLGIDQLFMKHYINVANAYAGRMAIGTAAFFFASGAAILLLSIARRFRHRTLILAVLGSGCAVQGMVAFAGYFTEVATVYLSGDAARMSIQTAFAAAAVGSALLLLAWSDQEPRKQNEHSYWIPALAGLGVLTVTLCMWQALIVQQRAQTETMVKTRATNLRHEVAGHMQTRMQALRRVAERWEQSGKPNREAWEENTKLDLRDFAGLLAIWWVDKSAEEVWTSQSKSNRVELDLNGIFAHPTPAISNEEIIRVTPAFHPGDSRAAFQILVSIYEKGQLTGFIVGTQSAQALFDECIAEGDLGSDFEIAVLDGNTQIYGSEIGDRRSRQTEQKTEMTFPGATWQIWVWPRPTALAQFRSGVPNATLIVGLITALLLSGSVRLAQNARRHTRQAEQANQEMAREIDERERMEGILKESEERYRDLFENANDIVYTHDLDGNYTSVNKACERITGYTHAESLRMNLTQVLAPEYLGKGKELLAEKLRGKAPPPVELEIITKDGHRVTLEVNSRLIYRDGKPSGVQGMPATSPSASGQRRNGGLSLKLFKAW